MEKLEKAKLITKIVWNSVWLVAAAFFWCVGLWWFTSHPTGVGRLFDWLMWGILCTPFIIIYIIKLATKSSKDSARDASHHYTIDYSAGRIYNHTFGGAVFGFLIGLAVGIFAGPIVLPGSAIKKIIELVKNIKYLRDSKE